MNNHKKGFAGIIIVVIVALGLLGFGAYKVFHQNSEIKDSMNISTGDDFPSDYQPADHKSDSNTVVSVLAENWKTYKNEKYGFVFEYPDNWKAGESSSEAPIIVSSPDFKYVGEIHSEIISGSQMVISKSANQYSSIDDYRKEMEKEFKLNDLINIKINGTNAIEYYFGYESPEKLFVVFIKNNYRYTITFETVGKAREDRNYSTFTKILSTFKFTDIYSSATSFTKIKIALLGMAAKDGDENRLMGCDLVNMVERTIPYTTAPLNGAMNELFAKKEPWPKSETYSGNFISSQKNLFFDRATLENGVARIYLTGYVTLAGECDDPRLETQINETAKQFSTVKSVEIFVGGKRWTTPSLK